MALSPSYYDFLQRSRPYLVEAAESDAAALLSRASPPEVIISADDFDSSLASCFEQADEQVLQQLASLGGVTVDALRPSFESAKPQARAQFSSLYLGINMEYHCLVNFALAGKRLFAFSDNLGDHLANTEINLKADLVKLPFSSCLFQFTSRSVIDALHNLQGEKGRIAMNSGSLDYEAPVSVFLSMLPAAPLPGHKLLIASFHAQQPDKCYMAVKREIYMGEGWSLEQALRTNWETLTPDNLGPAFAIKTEENEIGPSQEDTFYTDGLLFFRTMLNAVLYLGSEQAELVPFRSERKAVEERAAGIVSANKRRKKLQEAARYSCLDYVHAGGSVQPIVVQRGGHKSVAGHSGNAKPSVRFVVRGHWRPQHYGPGLKDRKLVWIKPYYKGPELADIVCKPYLVR